MTMEEKIAAKKEELEAKAEALEDKIEAKLDVLEDAAEAKFAGVKAAIEEIVDDVEAAAEAHADTFEDIVDDLTGDDDACAHDEGCDCGCEEHELFEIEIDEEDIIGYIYDEDDNEIGFIIEEDGEEIELYYASDDEYEYVEEEAEEAPAKKGKKSSDNEFDLGITRENVAATTDDMNAIYKDGIQIAAELKDTFDDINSSFDFLRKKK